MIKTAYWKPINWKTLPSERIIIMKYQNTRNKEKTLKFCYEVNVSPQNSYVEV